MFKYGLVLQFEGDNNPFNATREVEGYLILPNTTPIAVWGSWVFKGTELVEVLPVSSNNVQEFDKILDKIIKRLKDRIQMIRDMENMGGGNVKNISATKVSPSQPQPQQQP